MSKYLPFEFTSEYRKKFKEEALKPEPFLRGRNLIEIGFHQGPFLGEILMKTYDLQLEEEICTYEEAISYVKKNYSPQN